MQSRAKLAAPLNEQGWRVSSTSVGRLLHRLGYRLQSPRKRQEGATHPDRNAQFEHINQTADEHLTAGQPVISVDTKKKELVGNFKNGGREVRNGRDGPGTAARAGLGGPRSEQQVEQPPDEPAADVLGADLRVRDAGGSGRARDGGSARRRVGPGPGQRSGYLLPDRR